MTVFINEFTNIPKALTISSCKLAHELVPAHHWLRDTLQWVSWTQTWLVTKRLHFPEASSPRTCPRPGKLLPWRQANRWYRLSSRVRWEQGCGVTEPHLAGGRARALVVRGILLPGGFQPQTFWGSFQSVCVCVCEIVKRRLLLGRKTQGRACGVGSTAGRRVGGTIRRTAFPKLFFSWRGRLMQGISIASSDSAPPLMMCSVTLAQSPC